MRKTNKKEILSQIKNIKKNLNLPKSFLFVEGKTALKALKAINPKLSARQFESVSHLKSWFGMIFYHSPTFVMKNYRIYKRTYNNLFKGEKL